MRKDSPGLSAVTWNAGSDEEILLCSAPVVESYTWRRGTKRQTTSLLQAVIHVVSLCTMFQRKNGYILVHTVNTINKSHGRLRVLIVMFVAPQSIVP